MTHTVAGLAVSAMAFCEIERRLIEAGYGPFEPGKIDMTGIQLVRDDEMSVGGR